MSGEISKYCREKLEELKCFISIASSNLFVEPSISLEIIASPFLGIKECFSTTKYGYLMFNIFLNYMVSYITSCIFYFYCIFPLTCLIYSIIFGPAGFLFAIGHGALFCNIVACHETRISSGHFMDLFFTMVVTTSKILEKPKVGRILPVKESKDPISWRIIFIAQVVRWMVVMSKLLMWFVISLIPVLGIILLKLQSSASRGFTYFIPYLEGTKRMDKRCMKEAYYKSFGKWLLFGLTTGFTESIPILAGISISTNTCGCALWEVDHAINVENPELKHLQGQT
ncbi:hypothetical protein HG536_0F03820 [Torulaspora globosa]|uniref:Outer spore wall protein RRT8 n=1 Tax=Torulaspora globosa TaxID=48254 RepID=A0A7G3ZKM1_9SACH|nr:uncharacterized protein HG536_0F03820 [Torulaspora globosa]QLL34057.1 hypothetical protein HG536_0F03820 [Torulaspora globosa]